MRVGNMIVGCERRNCPRLLLSLISPCATPWHIHVTPYWVKGIGKPAQKLSRGLHLSHHSRAAQRHCSLRCRFTNRRETSLTA